MTTTLERLLSRFQPEAVFLDCDGIIFDTNRLKCDAFRYALAGAPSDAVERLVAHHKATGGVSRYLKIEHFYRRLFPVPEPDQAIARALARFGEYCEDGYRRMRPRREALAFADLFGPDRVWVVSASDEDELRRVFRAQEIDHHFADVHGSPATKTAHLTRILGARGLAPTDALFVGDGGGDWGATGPLGMPFVFLAEMSEWSDGPATIGRAIDEGKAAAIARDWDELLGTARAALADRT
ncbi:MAG: HAD family hydrolase [Deltaproteobacteria bacterium]|nr:HAD family hydrolase [Deltaproteobacteria bacterium]